VRIIPSVRELRSVLSNEQSIVLVPTMGNLHAGHLSLIRRARTHGGLVVASIFVNPLQFAPTEDFATYPRTLERDCALLEAAGCDVAFTPSEQEIYPEPQTYTVRPPAALADILEGQTRPGFFTGVCTVVLKLFQIVQPQATVFGKKDYQQLLVIRRMVDEFALPIEIIAGETVRESSGLALSSRNGYLDPVERQEAPRLHATLQDVLEQIREGRRDFLTLEREAAARLRQRAWAPDYVAIRRRRDLGLPAEGELVVLGAAALGRTRLIDNLELLPDADQPFHVRKAPVSKWTKSDAW
jgi:pantoate--beta-alanine ligase